MTTEERLEKLERELACAKRRNRWLLSIVGLTVVGLGLAVVGLGLTRTWTKTTAAAQAQAMGAVPKVISAEAFILVDENGKCRAALDMTMNKDGPMLRLSDENGKTRAVLAAFKDVSWLSLYDENSKVRAAMNVNKNGPGMTLLDENGKTVWKAP